MPEISGSEILIVLSIWCLRLLCLNGLIVGIVGGLTVLGFHVYTSRARASQT